LRLVAAGSAWAAEAGASVQAGRERKLVTAAMLASMFLAALEATAVATAMPTIVSELGSVERYSWAFSAYLLTSTTTVPLYGKLADLYGRKRIFIFSVALFLAGSVLCGVAGSFAQLILFRAIQGLGAGGVMPVAITIVGDIYTLEERGRVQGLFSAVWAVASLVGPAVGGLVTDLASWRWVFYFNLPFGFVAAAMVHRYLQEEESRREHRLDIVGTVLLTGGVALFLVALQEGSTIWGWADARTLGTLAVAVVALAFFVRQELRAPEPMLPFDLFRVRLIAVASIGSIALGTLLFTLTAYVPMFVQGVLGGSASEAGATLMPMSLGWPVASTLAGWLLMRAGYRPLVLLGAITAFAGCLLLASLDAGSDRTDVMLAMLVVGAGLGFVSTPYIVAVQAAVPRSRRGVATSSQQFFRTIGGAIAVTVFGAVLNAYLLNAAGAGVSAQSALDPSLRQALDPESLGRLVLGLREGLHVIYLACAVAALAGCAVAFLFPRGSAASLAHGAAVPTPAPPEA
jgi:EmrB/QacA subfamily drug resistance transporter